MHTITGLCKKPRRLGPGRAYSSIYTCAVCRWSERAREVRHSLCFIIYLPSALGILGEKEGRGRASERAEKEREGGSTYET